MMILVTYDVSTVTAEGRSRLRRVAKICEDYGQRVQNSVFECLVDPTILAKMEHRLVEAISLEEDNLRIYRLREPLEKSVKQYGTFRSLDLDGPLIF